MIFRRLVAALFLLAAAGACTSPHQQSIGLNHQTPHIDGEAFIAADGARLPLRRWLPEGDSRAVILALHGFNDYSNAFDAPGNYWRERGIATYAYDQRGFGATAHAGVWPPQNALIDDARAAISVLRERYPGLPLFVLGESMGGAVLLSAAGEAPLEADGVILVAPAVWARETMNPFYRAALWLGAHFFPEAEFTGKGLGVVASDNREMILALRDDPLVIKSTRVDAMWGLVNLMDSALEASARLTPPALVLYGANDQLIEPGPTARMVAQLSSDIPVAVYETGWHMLLRDLNAEIVLADIAAWISNQEGNLPSGAVKAGENKFSRPVR
jgi:acylglycerol lipase